MYVRVRGEKMAKYISTLSGGPDSTTAAYWAKDNGYDIQAITLDYGQMASEEEVEHAKGIAERLDIPHTVMPLRGLQDGLNRIPNGEPLELSVSMYANAAPFGSSVVHSIATINALSTDSDGIIYSTHATDRHELNPNENQYTRTFLDKWEELVEFNEDESFEILAPFVEMSKAEVIELGDELGVPFEETWSCVTPTDEGIHCGECLGCTLRRRAFEESSVDDPTEYKTDALSTVEEALERDEGVISEEFGAPTAENAARTQDD